MPTVDVWFPAVMTLLGAILGAAMEHFYSGRNWLRQQQWSNREKYYTDLLRNLRKLELSLLGRSEYYLEPGSEHRDYEDDPAFGALATRGGEAFGAIRELAGPACMFLSSKAIGTLEVLEREQWHAAQDPACTADYVSKMLALVEQTQAAIRSEARLAVAR